MRLHVQTRGISRMKRALALLVLILGTFWTARAEDDPARQLARILAEKGLLTSEELATVERADGGDAVRMLSELLHQKGILTQSEMARVIAPATSPSSQGVRFVPAVLET